MLKKINNKKTIFMMWIVLWCIWIGLAISLIQITIYAPLQFMIVTTGVLLIYICCMHYGRKLEWGGGI